MFENLREYDDNNFVELVEKTNSATGGLRGTLPRRSLYSSQEALDMGLFPLDNTIPLPPQSWKKIIEECHGKQIFPFYHQARTNLFNPWDQDGLGYCWAWSLTACVMGTRAVEGQKPVLLAPVSLGYSAHGIVITPNINPAGRQRRLSTDRTNGGMSTRTALMPSALLHRRWLYLP